MKFFTHKLQLIERTKLLEGIPCQSITFTNVLGRNFNTEIQAFNRYRMKHYYAGIGNSTEESTDDEYIKNLYFSPINSSLLIVSPLSVANHLITTQYYYESYKSDPSIDCSVTLSIDGKVTTLKDDEQLSIDKFDNVVVNYDIKTEGDISAAAGLIEVAYVYSISYIISGRNDYYPTKPNTITSAINRILDLAEPLYQGDSPRFVLNPVQAQKWEDVPLPNTTMTQCTLREQLQHIGNYIHGQARLGGFLNEDITYNGVEYKKGYYENMIFYDEYGGIEESTYQGKPYVYNQVRHSINDYNTQIDTYAQNVVNSLDYNDGVISSPDTQNFKSLRTESINVRLSESNCLIETELPIYDVVSVKVKAFDPDSEGWYVNDDGVGEWDITPFVFEAHEYNSVLSSYGGGYPYSKSYAIYYTQGEKNINGLFFKPTTESSATLGDYINKYSIVNILKSVEPNIDWQNYVTNNFPYLSFQVSYIPFYNTRYSHTDGYIGKEKKLPFAKIYNQSENVVETRFYGENIKGVAQRLGNQEAVRVYMPNDITNLPKIGTKLDGYYISQVKTEFYPFCIRSTVGLTKKFNRLSQNVGINSHKRVAEVSEREAYDRNVLLKEYICIGSKESLPLKQDNLQLNTDGATLYMFTGANGNDNYDVQSVAVTSLYRKNDLETPIARIKSPVVSSAFGNCMSFSWDMKDNYSGGTEVIKSDDEFWQKDVPYSDYYGKAYWLKFDLHRYLWGSENKSDAMTSSATDAQGYEGEVIRSLYPLKIRKDSREIIKMNVAIEYVTNREDLIICSGCASCNPLISNLKKTESGVFEPKVYFFADKTRAFDSIRDRDYVSVQNIYRNSDNSFGFLIPKSTEFKSWAIAYAPVETVTTVYNEDTGENEECTTYTGGEILIACNNDSQHYGENDFNEVLYIKKYRDRNKD